MSTYRNTTFRVLEQGHKGRAVVIAKGIRTFDLAVSRTRSAYMLNGGEYRELRDSGETYTAGNFWVAVEPERLS